MSLILIHLISLKINTKVVSCHLTTQSNEYYSCWFMILILIMHWLHLEYDAINDTKIVFNLFIYKM